MPKIERNRIQSLAITMALFVATSAHAQIKIHKTLDVEDGLVQSQVNAIYEDRDGFVWFGTFGGVSRWDGNGFENFHIQDGLAALDVRIIHETLDGAILFGTGENGISIYRDGEFTTLNADAGLSGNSVRSFYRGEDGSLSVATQNGIMVFADESLDTTTAIHLLPGYSVSTITGCASGGTYVSTFGEGVLRIYNGQAQRIDPDEQLPAKMIRAVREAPDGTLYISVYRNGVWLMNDGEFRPFPYNADLGGHDVKAITLCRDGTLYFSTLGGVSPLLRTAYSTSLRRRMGWQARRVGTCTKAEAASCT